MKWMYANGMSVSFKGFHQSFQARQSNRMVFDLLLQRLLNRPQMAQSMAGYPDDTRSHEPA
jgi:hypothetical protein